ncbi:general secretion pathway protein GspB [Massilia sp. B-10]|nr:general secretion pathway protein GspB [Massilia sp. B-10]UUZ54712.1 general secretion pathway protein GspB [Massilia sp. H-1]
MIDGKMVREGQRVGNTVIETIRPTEVVIRRGSVRTTLKLFRQAKQVAADQP